LANYAARGNALAEVLWAGVSAETTFELRSYFERLGSAMTKLATMAKAEQTGTPFDQEQLAFINEAVTNRGGACGGPPLFDGWFAKLHYGASGGMISSQLKPTITDVHTQQTDEVENTVGRILHVGTGIPRLMVVTVNTCQRPRAYAGAATAYHEQITSDWKRLTDAEWSQQLLGVPRPADVAWADHVSP